MPKRYKPSEKMPSLGKKLVVCLTALDWYPARVVLSDAEILFEVTDAWTSFYPDSSLLKPEEVRWWLDPLEEG